MILLPMMHEKLKYPMFARHCILQELANLRNLSRQVSNHSLHVGRILLSVHCECFDKLVSPVTECLNKVRERGVPSCRKQDPKNDVLLVVRITSVGACLDVRCGLLHQI